VPAVNGAAGVHIVLPGYYNNANIGLVDMNTSDGRFLFFLPWQDHVLVGTTDTKCKPTMRPEPAEEEVRPD
jgi:glycerol-3-phosphate dehydrogenase